MPFIVPPEGAIPCSADPREDGRKSVFAIQFLTALSEEGLPFFSWAPDGFGFAEDPCQGFTDNIVDLMAGKLTGYRK
jgi:hypothetical protein